jgi:hypothetical protein
MLDGLSTYEHLLAGKVKWQKNPPSQEWDRALADLAGHPLQSCLWGDARRDTDAIVQHRWLLRHNGAPIWMIRIEERKVLGSKIAWAPKGPTGATKELGLSLRRQFEQHLRAEGFSLLISNPWIPVDKERSDRARSPRTIWLDLSLGADAIFANFHTQMRKGVRRAQRGGIDVQKTCDPRRIIEFVSLCSTISQKKRFDLRVTSDLIESLLRLSKKCVDVEAAQFVSLKDDKLAAGLFAIRLGRNVHQIWSATNRDMRRDRVGEACQWAVIKWAIACGCTRYDLEGIDPVQNPSVYEFKKRLGGQEITLKGHIHTPLRLRGHVLSRLIEARSNYS